MKKTVLEMFFLHDHNPRVDIQIPRFVYRHCSHIPFHKIKRLAEKLAVNPEKIFVTAFAQLMVNGMETESIAIVKRLNGHDFSLWECCVDRDSFYNTLKHVTVKTKSKRPFAQLETLAIKFEIKVVKYKMLFSYFYPEDFLSETFSSQMVYDFEKRLREIIKFYEI